MTTDHTNPAPTATGVAAGPDDRAVTRLPVGPPGPTTTDSHRDARLARLLADQRRRWEAGDRVPAETYPEHEPWLRGDAEGVLDLIYNELLLRQALGESPGLAEYVGRFPLLRAELEAQFAVEEGLRGADLTVGRAATPATASAGLPPAPPGYEVLGVLGRGGMGVVYKARQTALKREVALKVLLAGGHASDAQRVRFLAEAEAVAAVNHPGVVQVHDFGTWDGQPYLALEFCPGGTLAQKLASTPLPPREAAALVERLAVAVASAHARGVVHRDIKPANVLLAADGVPKVADFGLAKLVESGAGVTATGAVMGTPSYMAPEQACGDAKAVGPAADVYGLGAVLYECLTGRPPFKGTTPADTALQVLHQDPVGIRALNPLAPADLETVCHKCLEKEPHKRYASAGALAADLGAFLGGRPVTARPVGAAGRLARLCRRNPAVSALAAGVVVLVVGGGIAAWVLAVAARREATAARAALDERDRAVARQRAVVREFIAHLMREARLTEEEKDRLVASFCREHPEYSQDELRAAMRGEPFEAGGQGARTFNENFHGD